MIAVDQGLDTNQISPMQTLDATLVETRYILSMDDRLGKLVDSSGILASYDYIDDDHIAYYTLNHNDTFVKSITDTTNSPSQVIQGPRGTQVKFRIKASMDTNTSSYLFTTLGGTESLPNRTAGGAGTSTVYYIDSNIRLTGVRTGCMIDIPVRYVRLQ